MMNHFVTIWLLVLFLSCKIASAQVADKVILTAMSHQIVKEPQFDLLADPKRKQPGRYNAWMYQNFMLLEGMDALYEVTGDEVLKDYSNRNIDFIAKWQAEFGESMKSTPSGNRKWYSRPKEIWQCGMIAKFAERQQTNPFPEFERGMQIFDQMLERSPTFDDGVLVRKKWKRSRGLQIDDLYMLTPYWCRKAELLDDDYWLDRAIEESISYHNYLWNDHDQLMKILWLEERKGTFGLYWGRGNGWYIMAITDLLDFIPEDHPKRQTLLSHYRDFIDGIVARQGEEGLWHQVLDHPESFTESSCSGMFTYCILKGVNQGWLTEKYLEPGRKGWKGLLTKLDENLEIRDTCPPTDMSEDLNYYKNRGQITHDQHGIGPFFLAGAEYLRSMKDE